MAVNGGPRSRRFVKALGVTLATGMIAAACGQELNAAPVNAEPAELIEPELLFASGFGEGVSISPDLLDIVGTDADTGFSWDNSPEWVESVGFYHAINRESEATEFVGTDIIDAVGPDGELGRVLHLTNKGDDPAEGSTTRNELSFFGQDEGATFAEGYFRYDTMLQADLDQIVPDGVQPRLYYLLETKDRPIGQTGNGRGHSGFRINVGISQDPETRELFWVATGEQVQPERVIDWQDRNVDVQVPLGEWFEIETYIRRHPTDGRVYVAVNGEVVFDLTVRTQHRDEPQPLLFWSPIKLYHDETWWAEGPTEQWYDDIELWNGLPDHIETTQRVQP